MSVNLAQKSHKDSAVLLNKSKGIQYRKDIFSFGGEERVYLLCPNK